jgi:hypothetical protein
MQPQPHTHLKLRVSDPSDPSGAFTVHCSRDGVAGAPGAALCSSADLVREYYFKTNYAKPLCVDVQSE